MSATATKNIPGILIRAIALLVLLQLLAAAILLLFGEDFFLFVTGLGSTRLDGGTALAILILILATSALLLVLWASRVSASHHRQQLLILESLDRFEQGILPVGVSVVGQGLSGETALRINEILDAVVEPVQKIKSHDAAQKALMELLVRISSLKDGDLSVQLEESDDLSGAIGGQINALTGEISALLASIEKDRAELGASAKEVQEATALLLERTLEQTKEAASLVSLSQKAQLEVELLSQLREKTAAELLQNQQISAPRQRETRAIIEGLSQAGEQKSGSKEFMTGFQENILEMAHVAKALDDYADRIAILALNTSIQTAMTDGAPSGLGEIATEIESLAKASAATAENLGRLSEAIKTEVLELLHAVSEGKVERARCERYMLSVEEALASAATMSNKATELGEAVDNTLTGHCQSFSLIVLKTKDLAETLRQSALVDNKTLAAMEETENILARIGATTSRFTLKENAPRH